MCGNFNAYWIKCETFKEFLCNNGAGYLKCKECQKAYKKAKTEIRVKTIEYKERFLYTLKRNGIEHWLAVQLLDGQIGDFGYSETPEDDAQEAIYSLRDQQ